MYPCKECEYQATTKGCLIHHEKSTHEGIKYPCKGCDYQATQKWHFIQHKESAHKGSLQRMRPSRNVKNTSYPIQHQNSANEVSL